MNEGEAMTKSKRVHVLAMAIAALSVTVTPAWAQTGTGHVEHHGGRAPAVDAPRKTQGSMPAMGQDGMNHEATPATSDSHSGMKPDAPQPSTSGAMPGMNHGSPSAPQRGMSGLEQGTGTMDHGDMNMQGGAAPPNARDPHAYSGGYTLDSGPHALPGPRLLRLADEHSFGALRVERLERVHTRDGNATAYDTQAWFGRNYERLVLKAEGDAARGKLQEAQTEVLWGHAVATYWDTQLGVRYDSGVGPDRGWLAFGIQGLAPYWFEVDATAYVGNSGRIALSLEAEYELLLTQKLILQPRMEINAYGRRDPARDIGSGLSDAAVGLRLRYEITRQFAPYVGVEWASKFGESADLARAGGEKRSETRWVGGVRFWF